MSAFSDMPKTLRNASVSSGRQNNDRRFPGIKGRAPHKYRLRCEVAEQNAAERAARTPRQQLSKLDQRLGKDVGATKERARLRALIRSGK